MDIEERLEYITKIYTREELLKELSNYKIVPIHERDLNELTNQELEFQLKLYESMFDEELWEV
ncbi:hypothetical protein [Clostridium brassicae]|uniref:Uncharacterized protein n=1 Tax=Clostridium brassicae TaxID=2999072 RepID=A0ABT4D6M5_9CLOT|nr:hypothetical protein [Clostridium brassicae]MCY6957833.1 hypothetical protein [Clostridium brassicae]